MLAVKILFTTETGILETGQAYEEIDMVWYSFPVRKDL